jgi:hypothetical protein
MLTKSGHVHPARRNVHKRPQIASANDALYLQIFGQIGNQLMPGQIGAAITLFAGVD